MNPQPVSLAELLQRYPERPRPPAEPGRVLNIPRAPGVPCEECNRRHRSWYTLACCRWPKALWVCGSPRPTGPCFALVSYCRRNPTITLWPALEGALDAKSIIDCSKCGGRCVGRHQVYQFVVPAR